MADIFRKQLSSIKGQILVLTSPRMLDEVKEKTDQRHNVKLICVENIADQSELPNENFELVICIGQTNDETFELYTLANSFKRQGIPVVFGYQPRSLIFQPPTWRDADLLMPGMFYLAGFFVKGLDTRGSYAEFGVFDGRSLTLAYHALKNACERFYGFDSFEGIVGSHTTEKQLYPDGSYFANLETLRHNLKLAGVDESRFSAIKGPFQETLKKDPSAYNMERVSICHIDSDIYEAAYLALNFIKPALIPGALILFDEYHAFSGNPDRGERRAVRQWLSENPDISLELYRNYTAVGAAFIYHKK
jgi:hypothetical protein